jgi:hypothetical protein
LSVEGYDEGVITAGDGVTLVVDSESDTWTLNVSGDVIVDTTSSGEDAVVEINGASGSTVTWDYDGAIEELTLNGDMTFIASAESFDAEVAISGPDATLVVTDATLNLTDVDVAAVQVGGEDGATVTFSSAEGKMITVVVAEADVTMDSGDDGGDLSVTLVGDDATLDLGAAEADSATVIVGAEVATIFGLTTATSLEIQTAAGGDVTFDAEGEGLASGDEAVTITGAGAVTINSFEGSLLDATAATGAIDVTLVNEGATIETGRGADTLTFGAEAEGDVTAMSNDGNDTFNLELFAGDSYFVDGGSGNDLFVLATVEGSTDVAADNIAIAGGAGSDTARVTLDAEGETGWDAAIDFSALDTFSLDGIETFNIVGSSVDSTGEGAELASEGDVTFGANTVDGLTLSITGSTATNQQVTFNMGAEGTSLDLSAVTVATNIETVFVDFSVGADGEDAITATTTARGELVIGPNDVSGFDINLAGGNDTFYIMGFGGDLALGSGDDTVVFSGEGVAIDAEDAATGVIAISDFNNAVDVIFDAAGTGIGADVIAAEGEDVSGAADPDAEATDILAIVSDGVVSLIGDDADEIDTVEEWIAVVALLDTGIYAFEFDGSTYVVNQDETDAVQLVGVTGLSLSSGSGDDLITISA